MKKNLQNDNTVMWQQLMFNLCALTLMLVFVNTGYAQKSVSGKVTSGEDSSTMPGVSIIEKGTANGTITDVEGNYTIEVSGNNGSIWTISTVITSAILILDSAWVLPRG